MGGGKSPSSPNSTALSEAKLDQYLYAVTVWSNRGLEADHQAYCKKRSAWQYRKSAVRKSVVYSAHNVCRVGHWILESVFATYEQSWRTGPSKRMGWINRSRGGCECGPVCVNGS